MMSMLYPLFHVGLVGLDGLVFQVHLLSNLLAGHRWLKALLVRRPLQAVRWRLPPRCPRAALCHLPGAHIDRTYRR